MLGRFVYDRQSADPRCIQTRLFEWRTNLEIVECRPLEDVLSIVVHKKKKSKFKNLKFKNPSFMNFELGGHIVWNAELKRRNRIFRKLITSLLK